MSLKLYIFTTNKVLSINDRIQLFNEKNCRKKSICEIRNSFILNDILPLDDLPGEVPEYFDKVDKSTWEELINQKVEDVDDFLEKIEELEDEEINTRIQKLICEKCLPAFKNTIYQLVGHSNVFAYCCKNERAKEEHRSEFDALLLDCIYLYNKQEKKRNVDDFIEKTFEDFEFIHFIVHDKDIYSHDVSDKSLSRNEVEREIYNNKLIQKLNKEGKIHFYVFMHEPHLPVTKFLNKTEFKDEEVESLINNLKSIPIFEEVECKLFDSIFKYGKDKIRKATVKSINDLTNELSYTDKVSLEISKDSNIKEFKINLEHFYLNNNIKLK